MNLEQIKYHLVGKIFVFHFHSSSINSIFRFRIITKITAIYNSSNSSKTTYYISGIQCSDMKIVKTYPLTCKEIQKLIDNQHYINYYLL